jgi:hypothetical protein
MNKTSVRVGREKGKCDICGEPAAYQIYDIRMTREYQDDGQGILVKQVALPYSLEQLCERCYTVDN